MPLHASTALGLPPENKQRSPPTTIMTKNRSPAREVAIVMIVSKRDSRHLIWATPCIKQLGSITFIVYVFYFSLQFQKTILLVGNIETDSVRLDSY